MLYSNLNMRLQILWIILLKKYSLFLFTNCLPAFCIHLQVEFLVLPLLNIFLIKVYCYVFILFAKSLLLIWPISFQQLWWGLIIVNQLVWWVISFSTEFNLLRKVCLFCKVVQIKDAMFLTIFAMCHSIRIIAEYFVLFIMWHSDMRF